MAAEDAGAVEAVAETDSIGELGGGRCFRAGHPTITRLTEKRKTKKFFLPRGLFPSVCRLCS